MGIAIRVGDEVEVISGTRNRNKDLPRTRGRVLSVDRERNRVTVQGHNKRIKHLKKSQQHPQGGRLEREAPIALSNVKIVTVDGNAVRLSKARREKDGKVVAKPVADATAGS